MTSIVIVISKHHTCYEGKWYILLNDLLNLITINYFDLIIQIIVLK